MGDGVLESSGVIDQEARQFLGKAAEGMVCDIKLLSLILKILE